MFKNFNIKDNDIINEAEVHPGGTINIPHFKDLLNKVNKGICKIILENNGYGTGFFAKIEDPEEEEKVLRFYLLVITF